jgi:hypothetical protein
MVLQNSMSFEDQARHKHILLTIFNILPYLTSLLLAACEGTTVSVHCVKTYREWCYIPLYLGCRSLLVVSIHLLGFETRPFDFTTCNLFIILIILSRFPLLPRSWFIHWSSCCMELHSRQHDTLYWTSKLSQNEEKLVLKSSSSLQFSW